MKNRTPIWIGFAVFLVILMVPALTYFGVKDFLPVAGHQQIKSIPKLTWETFKTRKYQLAVEDHFAKRLFLRGLLYRTRCQTMELVNFGTFHEGSSQKIGQFKDGTLFEYAYFNDYYNPNCKLSKENVKKTLQAIGDLGKVLASNGVDMVFVIATDKVEFMRKPMPRLTSALFKKRRNEFQTEFGNLLSDYGIFFFDTFSFLTNEAPKHAEQMFPYAGTHWNALASSLVVDELLTRLNLHASKPYAINRFSGVEETSGKAARFKDDDIGLLLNLLYNPYLKKNKRYLPKFEDEDFTPNEGGVIIFGDSFSWQLAETMKRSKDFDPVKTLVFDKRLPSANELNRISSNLRLVVFVYVTPHFLRMDRWPDIGGPASTLCRLLADRYRSRELSLNDPILFYSDKERGRQYFRSGLSHKESGWTWTDGHEAVMHFYTSSSAPKLFAKIDCSCFHHLQKVIVEVNGETAFNGTCGKQGFAFVFDNPGVGKDVELKFIFPEAKSPKEVRGTSDMRVLALRLRSIVITETIDSSQQ